MNMRPSKERRAPSRPSSPTSGIKVPPHFEAAEKAILGMLLLRPDLFDLLIVQPDDFYSERHQEIFRAIRTLAQAGRPVDSISVANSLSEADRERFGGLLYISQLSDDIPTAANIGYYDKIVKDKARLRQMIEVAHQILEEAYDGDLPPEESDAVMERAEQNIMKIRQDDAGTGGMVRLSEVSRGYFEQLEHIFEGRSKPGLSTGLKDVDTILGGLRPGQLIVLAARPSMGKSSLAGGITLSATFGGGVVPVFSPEMTRHELYTLYLSQRTKVDSRALRGQIALREEWIPKLMGAAQEFEALDLFIGDAVNLTPSRVRSQARRLKAKKGRLDLIVVDYLQLLKGDQRNSGKREEVEEISRELKIMGGEFGCPVLALSQLNRKCEERPDKRPLMSDLRDSGSIEQDADVVMFVYRDEVYYEDSVEKGVAEIIFRKNRGGQIGTAKVGWEASCTRFYDLSPSSY